MIELREDRGKSIVFLPTPNAGTSLTPPDPSLSDPLNFLWQQVVLLNNIRFVSASSQSGQNVSATLIGLPASTNSRSDYHGYAEGI